MKVSQDHMLEQASCTEPKMWDTRNQEIEERDTTFTPLILTGWEQKLCLGLQEAGARDEEPEDRSRIRVSNGWQGLSKEEAGSGLRLEIGGWQLRSTNL